MNNKALESTARPRRHLAQLLELLGEHQVCRQLNVHRTTVQRWQRGEVDIPGCQHLAIRYLLGDLPGTDGQWTGWYFRDGLLVSPSGDKFDRGQIASFQLRMQQLKALGHEVDRLRIQVRLLEHALAQLPGAAANEARALG